MKEILKELNDNGYEAYIVGGYVRDYLLGINAYDVDICTNAPIEKIMKIFKGRGRAFKEYYAFHINENGFNYAITTFRKELEYRRNKPTKLCVADDLGTDLLRRDFTINTFAVDINDNLIDILGAKKDLDNKLIKVIGDVKAKFTEDKTRILRAIRFACTLDFDLDKDIIDFISNNNAYLLNEVPREYKKRELDKIFDSMNIDKFFYLVKRYNMGKYFNIRFGKIKRAYNKYGIYSQMECDLPFSNVEKNIIDNIRKLVSQGNIYFADFDKYSSEELYNAAAILDMESTIGLIREIKDLHSMFDIDISIDILFRYVDIHNLKRVYRLIERNIMEGKLENNRYSIEDFLRML